MALDYDREIGKWELELRRLERAGDPGSARVRQHLEVLRRARDGDFTGEAPGPAELPERRAWPG
jgi:hypothetical protein